MGGDSGRKIALSLLLIQHDEDDDQRATTSLIIIIIIEAISHIDSRMLGSHFSSSARLGEHLLLCIFHLYLSLSLASVRGDSTLTLKVSRLAGEIGDSCGARCRFVSVVVDVSWRPIA